ncbi:MAG: hypothetical protein F9K22_03905 [Bacteroidetes bacterium]|nr:MAG: hypothetical protein F9K22_03905 [Bacteroidota bacterium]
MLGTFALYLALFGGLLSILSYLRAANGDTKRVAQGRIGLLVTTAGILTASAVLMTDILTHDFTNAYVWSYSSRDLSPFLLVSTFWAGQEGSFLFWALVSSVLSLFLFRYTKKRKLEAHVMPLFLLMQSFLVLLMTTKSPFESIYAHFPGQISPPEVPNDGKGLNPLLQNFWMVIHPPVLFIGFAATAVPFAFGLAALWRREYQTWLSSALPWVLFSGLSLGAGLMLGAYWAYGVLGWGGYWGWDPVENSSLIPWIVLMALLHTMLVQQRTGKLVRTNFVFAILSYLLVIYSTFLTRSGVLGDSSVHSFTDPGTLVYGLLLVYLGGSALLGFGLFFLRRAELKAGVSPMHWLTREFALSAGALVLAVSAAVVFFGTSLPIVSTTTVDPSFYNTMHIPIAIAMSLLIGYSLLVRWDQEDGMFLKEKSWKHLASALSAALGVGVLSTWDASYLLFVFAAFFALSVNLELMYMTVRGDYRLMGGKLAHAGLAVFFVGAIVSGLFNEERTMMLEQGVPQQAFGYTVTYTGRDVTEGHKTRFTVSVTKEGSGRELHPVMFDTENQGVMRNPDIESFLTHDIYITPSGLEQAEADASGTIVLHKEESVTVNGAVIAFSAFDMTSHDASSSGSGMKVGIVLDITKGKEKERVVPTVVMGGGRPEYNGADSKLLGTRIELKGLNIGGMGDGRSAVQFTLADRGNMPALAAKETLVIEASIKPFISLVWVGTLLVLTGFVLSIQRRKRADTV